jgi:hypothetical protein
VGSELRGDFICQAGKTENLQICRKKFSTDETVENVDNVRANTVDFRRQS